MPDATFLLPPLPPALSRDQVRAALDVLGLPGDVRELTLGVYGATVTLLAKDPDGRPVHVGDDAAYLTVSLPYSDMPAPRQLTPEQQDMLRQELSEQWQAQVTSQGPNHGPMVL